MDIELHIFTNCTRKLPHTEIFNTYDSFCNIWGKLPVVVWCDPGPNKDEYKNYIQMLKNTFPIINKSRSLSYGVINAIKTSNTDYLFILEHDWKFIKENIKHTLTEILFHMKKENLYHLRWNKRSNILGGWDKKIKEKGTDEFKYCITNCLSNNPHILDRNFYIKNGILDIIEFKSGSRGIEKQLTETDYLFGSIYGPLNHPPTVKHLDGRKKRKK